MKKFLALFLALTMALALAGCADKNPSTSSSKSSNDTSTSQDAEPTGLTYVSGASMAEQVKDKDTTLYTYNAVVNGEITQITTNSNRCDGLYNELTAGDDGVYTQMALTGVEYEIVVGDFAKADGKTVTLGGQTLTCADDLVVYAIDLNGGITVGSIDNDYTGTGDYTIKVMYTTNDKGEVDGLYIKQNATFNYTTEEQLLAAAEKAGMKSAVLVNTFGNRANTKYMVKDDKGNWTVKFNVTHDSWCGRNGTKDTGTKDDNKKEGDGNSPTGMYPIFLHFGTKADPGVGNGVSYTQLQPYGHFWVDGEVNGSRMYNKFVLTAKAKGSVPTTVYGDYDYTVLDVNWTNGDQVKAERPNYGFNSCEWLWEETTAYAYASSIEYNTNWKMSDDGSTVINVPNSIVNNGGSCIFFHCKTTGATAGCISIPEDDYVTFLKTVDERGAMIAIN